jgi:hypothetical protein
MKKTANILKKELLKKLNENSDNISEEMITDQPGIDYNLDDQIGNIWIVKKAMKESTEDDLLQETDIWGLAEMINQQQVSKADIHGIYQVENKARRMSKRQINERDSSHKQTLKEAEGYSSDLDKKISDIKMEIENITSKGMDEPGMRDSVSSDLDPLYAKLTKLEDLKDRLDSSIEAEKPKKDKPKKDEDKK